MGRKLDEAKPAEKLLSLFTTLLFNNRGYSLGDLASMLECSKQTVSRLILQMESARYGKLRKEKRGKEVFYKMMRPERMPAISLDSEGLAQLVLCRDFLAGLLPKKMRAQMGKSLEAAVGYLPDGSQEMPESVGGSLAKGRIDYEPFQGFLDTMAHAIRKNRVCSIKYKKALNKPEREYDYAPKKIVAYREGIFILGYVVEDKGTAWPTHESPTSLALHRLTDCALTRRTSERVPEIPAPAHGAIGIMSWGEPFEVVVKFSPAAATYVAERQWSANQEITLLEDGSIILRAQAANEPECIAWALGFGAAAEVLEPAWLREKMAAELDAMAEKYKG